MAKSGTKKKNGINAALIAPCGMNCRLCVAYIRDKKPCPGCRGDDSGKPKTRVTCRIKTCEQMRLGKSRYCFDCDGFPCDRLNHLDERYRTKYGMSMVHNLVRMRDLGIRRSIRDEKQRWACPACGGTLCVHQPQCLSCGRLWR
jgi:hypothetical protein